MLLIQFLMAKFSLYGLDAPIFAWIAAAGLLVFTRYQLARLYWLVRRECRLHQQTMRRLETIRRERAVSPRRGLSGIAYDSIAKAFEETPSLLPAWQRFNAQIVMRHSIDGDDEFWGSESAEGAF